MIRVFLIGVVAALSGVAVPRPLALPTASAARGSQTTGVPPERLAAREWY
jgi:hypothetical protein